MGASLNIPILPHQFTYNIPKKQKNNLNGNLLYFKWYNKINLKKKTHKKLIKKYFYNNFLFFKKHQIIFLNNIGIKIFIIIMIQ